MRLSETNVRYGPFRAPTVQTLSNYDKLNDLDLPTIHANVGIVAFPHGVRASLMSAGQRFYRPHLSQVT